MLYGSIMYSCAYACVNCCADGLSYVVLFLFLVTGAVLGHWCCFFLGLCFALEVRRSMVNEDMDIIFKNFILLVCSRKALDG